MKIAFTIEGQAASKANSRKIVHFGGLTRIAKSKEALKFERDALRQIPHWARQQLTCPVKVTLRIWYATERPDLDESIVLDVLQDRYKTDKQTKVRALVSRGVYVNDRQVREKHVYHGIDRANPRVEIEIEPLRFMQERLDLVPSLEEAPF